MRDSNSDNLDPLRADFPMEVYTQLLTRARALIRQERQGHTLSATALVNEAWVKLRGDFGRAPDRKSVLLVVIRAMRQVLVESARRRDSLKRGGNWKRVTLGPESASSEFNLERSVELEEAMTELERIRPPRGAGGSVALLCGLELRRDQRDDGAKQ